jgi:hypothetical protein
MRFLPIRGLCFELFAARLLGAIPRHQGRRFPDFSLLKTRWKLRTGLSDREVSLNSPPLQRPSAFRIRGVVFAVSVVPTRSPFA